MKVTRGWVDTFAYEGDVQVAMAHGLVEDGMIWVDGDGGDS